MVGNHCTLPHDKNVMDAMVEVNRTTHTPISVLPNDVNKGLNFVPEFNIYPSSYSRIKVEGKS